MKITVVFPQKLYIIYYKKEGKTRNFPRQELPERYRGDKVREKATPDFETHTHDRPTGTPRPETSQTTQLRKTPKAILGFFLNWLKYNFG
jgi:hypothetical protein